jgi:hypothetical protein
MEISRTNLELLEELKDRLPDPLTRAYLADILAAIRRGEDYRDTRYDPRPISADVSYQRVDYTSFPKC